MSKSNANHKSNQSNSEHPAWQKANDNKSNQGNDNNRGYWKSRNQPVPTNKK